MTIAAPFNIDITNPAAPDLISQYPTSEHLFRDTVDSWLRTFSDPATGLMLPAGFPADFSFSGSPTIGADKIDHFPAGTKMVFYQTAAPTGWTKITTSNDAALRVVSGTAGSGGTVGFTTAFASQDVKGTLSATTAAGTIAGTALSVSQMPSHQHEAGGLSAVSGGAHSHTISVPALGVAGSDVAHAAWNATSGTNVGTPAVSTNSGGTHSHDVAGVTNFTGSGSTHTHTFTGTSHTHTFTGTDINLAVKYVDVILASKA
jgi:hypothetical protein